MPVESPEKSRENALVEIQAVLNRPPSERLREYKYRFAQSSVFGLPVVALHFAGPSLGGADAARWAGLLQVLLASWVMYVGLMAMGVEALMRRRLTVDAVFTGIGGGLYVLALIDLARIMSMRSTIEHGWFAAAVGVAMCWNGLRWRGMRTAIQTA
jgi:hypothetical protein